MDTERAAPKDNRPEPAKPEKGINWPAIIAWIVTTMAAGVGAWIHGNSCGCRTELSPVPGFHDAQADELVADLGVCAGEQGWVGERLERQAQIECLLMADTPAGRARQAPAEADPDVFLWLAAIKVTGHVLPAKNQGKVGSCVAFGNTCAHNYLACMQVALGRLEAYHELCEESLYGLMRHQVGKDRIRGDGGVGIWAAEAAKQFGVLARGKIGSYDVTAYDPSRCRTWGRTGPPAELLDTIRQHPVKDFAQCQSAADCRAALRGGYPIAVCSNVGFNGPRGGAQTERDADGFAPPRGSWAHCMAIIGYRGGARRGFLIQQSWGPKAATGPTYPPAGDPAAPPDGTWWADWNVVDRMAGQGGTFAFSDLVGFPAMNPWIVRRERGPRRALWCLRLPIAGDLQAENCIGL